MGGENLDVSPKDMVQFLDQSIEAIQKHIVEEVKFLEGGIVTLVESESRSNTQSIDNKERIVVAHVDFAIRGRRKWCSKIGEKGI